MKTNLIALLSCTLLIQGCRTLSDSEVSSRPPRLDNALIPQGGAPVANRCSNGGHDGPTEGVGWPFNPKEGCFVLCYDEAAAKLDYLDQLHRHRIFGRFDLIEARDPEGYKMAEYFWNRLLANGQNPHSFRDLTVDQIFDGKAGEWQQVGLEVGDILLNFNFGQPNHAGIFYSKRGIAHARLVVEVRNDRVLTFDGGWEQFSNLDELNSQLIWLRPKDLSPTDKDLIVRWAKHYESLPYDNLLVDDWQAFREGLHVELDKGSPRDAALTSAFSHASSLQQRPASFDDTFDYLPASGIYCSEGTAAIFAYLGFRLHGETAIEVATGFSNSGELPNWDLYADALSGFGASGDPKVFMMHSLFYHYFGAFDEARRKGLISLPTVGNLQQMSFADAASANLAHVRAAPRDNHLIKQLEDLRPIYSRLPGQAGREAVQKLDALLQNLRHVSVDFNAKTRTLTGLPQMNESQVIASIFFENRAYGPQSFFENATEFDFKGVFYNSNISRSGNQALFIGNWYNSVIDDAGQQVHYEANIQTTIYDIKPAAFAPGDDRTKCKIGEKVPYPMRGS